MGDTDGYRARHRAGGPGAADLRLAKAALLRRHWQSLREGAALPRRDRIVPRTLAPMLDHALLIERAPGGAILLRHAGLMLCALHGEDLIGRPLSVLFESGARIRLLEAVEGVLSGRQTLEMDLRSERGLSRPLLRGRLTLLPISGMGQGEVSAIGCLELDGEATLPPRRFRIDRVLGEPLAPARHPAVATARGGGGPVLVWSR